MGVEGRVWVACHATVRVGDCESWGKRGKNEYSDGAWEFCDDYDEI